MKQFDKLRELLKDPKKYGVKKNTRVYRMLEEIAMRGITQTGYSDKRNKYVETYGVFDALRGAGIACKHYNNAPRGGTSGEHVELIGKIAKDVKKGFKAFATRCELSGDEKYKYSWNIEDDYLETLKK
uniref:hypothetical protein n=1 Tax=Prevotella sp. TaxID=59823 RepID=UPI004024DE8F